MRKKLIAFYIVLVCVVLTFGALTWAWWDKDVVKTPEDLELKEWHLVYAKVVPCMIVALFTLFNVWIQCSNWRISRDIIMPWVSCRCSLYTFLIILPITMTIVELIGLFQYKNFWNQKAFYAGFYAMFAIALLVATWFQFTIFKWCCFVRKAINIRERRV